MALIIAAILFIFGILAFVLSTAVYESYPAPSVQGDASSPWIWLIIFWIAAAISVAIHFLG